MAINKAYDLNHDNIVNEKDIEMADSLASRFATISMADNIKEDILKNGGNVKDGVSTNAVAGTTSAVTPTPSPTSTATVTPNSTATGGLTNYYPSSGTGSQGMLAWTYNETTGKPQQVGAVPDKTGKFDTGTYAAGDEVTYWYNPTKSGISSPLDIDTFKYKMWKAGAYGTDSPVIDNGHINDSDTAALRTVMNYVQNNPGLTVAEAVDQMANYFDTQQVQILSPSNSSNYQKHLPRVIDANNPGDPRYMIQDYAEKNNIPLTVDFVNNNANKIEDGSLTIDNVKEYLRNTYAIPAYPAWKEELSSGQTIADIANPYIVKYANIMGVDTKDVKLDNPLIQDALNSIDAKGQPVKGGLFKFEQAVKGTPEYFLQSPEGKAKSNEYFATYSKAMGYNN
jgi:hypothetical protein